MFDGRRLHVVSVVAFIIGYLPPSIHTCHKLWTEICEIKKNKGNLIKKICEIFTKITLELPKNNQNALF